MIQKIKHVWDQPELQTTKARAILIGAPDDRGVMNVGGRIGAAHGPAALRQLLGQFMLGIDGEIEKIQLDKGFDVDLGVSIEFAHNALRQGVRKSLDAGQFPIVVGGGHDFGYPHFGGAYEALEGKAALINIDAHLDVRPPTEEGITSGSPFYLALEEGILKPKNFVEFGIQEHCNDQSFHSYLQNKGVQIISLDESRQQAGPAARLEELIEKFAKRKLKTVVSFDVDAIQMAHSPGVSAPQSDGFTPGEFFAMAKLCGQNKNVSTVGFFELSPPLDTGNMTTRLVATAIHRYLGGLSRRGEKTSRKMTSMSRLLGRRDRR